MRLSRGQRPASYRLRAFIPRSSERKLRDPVARLNRRAARLATLSIAMLVALPLVPATQAAGGGFAPYTAVALPSEPDAVAIGDVTGDGLADVVATTGY